MVETIEGKPKSFVIQVESIIHKANDKIMHVSVGLMDPTISSQVLDSYVGETRGLYTGVSDVLS